MNILAREGKLGDRLDDHICAAGSGVTDSDARREQREIDELASIYREIFDFLLINHRADHRPRGFGHLTDILHRYLLSDLPDGKVKVHIAASADIKVDSLRLLLEPGFLCRNGIVADGQRRNLIVASGRCGGRAGESSRWVRHRHVCL